MNGTRYYAEFVFYYIKSFKSIRAAASNELFVKQHDSESRGESIVWKINHHQHELFLDKERRFVSTSTNCCNFIVKTYFN